MRSKGGESAGSVFRPFKTSLNVLEIKVVVAFKQADEFRRDALNDTLVSCAGCNGILIGPV